MSQYDPFERGPYPAGVRTVEWTDLARDRTLPVEIWYPASEAHRGEDLDEAHWDRYKPMPLAPEVSQCATRDAQARSGPHPLIVFSHGFGGERRQTTHLCTHWASHGYVVVAMDHVGNTAMDMIGAAMGGESPDPAELIAEFIADRPADASFVIDATLSGDAGLTIDPDRIGISGHSFGGWTTLATTGRDTRIRAALPLAPAGGQTPLTPPGFADDMADALSLAWERPVETLYLVAEFDTLLPLEGMRDLLARTPAPCRGINLLNADHFHFCDRVEQTHDLFQTMGPMLAGSMPSAEGGPDMTAILAGMKSSGDLCPGEHAYALLQGLGLAHMDASLRDNADAQAFMAQDLVRLMADRGIAVELL
jgi:dienelactone hydrolase